MKTIAGAAVVVLTAIATLAVPGCSSMLTSDAPPDTTYWLEPAPITAVDGANGGKPSIRVTVNAAPGLDVDRLLVRGPGATLNAYAGARWADNIPDVIETLVRAALEDSGRFGVVAAARSGTRAAWELDLEVRAFYAVAAGALPTVELRLRGYLLCPDRVQPLRVDARHGARANTLTEISAAFQSVVNEGLAELIERLPATCEDPAAALDKALEPADVCKSVLLGRHRATVGITEHLPGDLDRGSIFVTGFAVWTARVPAARADCCRNKAGTLAYRSKTIDESLAARQGGSG